jgi:hypothetical protein
MVGHGLSIKYTVAHAPLYLILVAKHHHHHVDHSPTDTTISIGLDWNRLDWTGLESTGLDWTGVDYMTKLELTADNTDRDFLAQILHKGHHIRCDFTSRESKGSIDIKEGEDTRLFGC